MVLESNRTGRIFTILFISGFLYFQGGLLWSSQFIDRDKKKEKRKTTREKQKNKAKQKLVISNAYLWPCNTARERDRDSEKTRTFFPFFFFFYKPHQGSGQQSVYIYKKVEEDAQTCVARAQLLYVQSLLRFSLAWWLGGCMVNSPRL